MLDKLKQLVLELNESGIPLPLVRDNKTGRGSISLTMMVISFTIVLLGLLGKFSKVLDIDLTQGIYFFGITSALYFSRSISGNKNDIKIENKQESENKE